MFLKNRKQLGTLVKHRIRKQDIQTVYNSYTNPDPQTVSKLDELTNRFGSNKKCLIEELPNASDSITHWGTKIDNRIPHRLVLTFAEPQQLWAEFYLPQVLVESDIRLEVAEQQIRVYVPRYQQLLDEFLPKRIDDSRTTADWNSSKSVILYNKVNVLCILILIYILGFAGQDAASKIQLIFKFSSRLCIFHLLILII